MKFGICCAPNALGDPVRLLEVLQEAGADYVEWAVGSVMASEEQFESLRSVVAESALKPEAFCVFVPPHHRITGPNVDLGAALEYCHEAMRRMVALGAEYVVLGSAGARKVPEGFDKAVAWNQFIEFTRELGPRAADAGMTVVIEPLNSHEDNLVNSVAQGAEVVDTVAHPNVQLLADFYHMVEDQEPLSNIIDAGSRLKHTHLADLGRVAPGYAKDGEADFIGFFSSLRQVGYNNRCSFEGKFEDLVAQAKPVLAHMRRRYEESA
jgi:sugar phosphate isomerase/epimerase